MEKIDIKDINDIGFTSVKKVIDTSLQLSDKDLEKIICFNEENNYEYIIQYNEHNLVDSKNIIKLIRKGYVMSVNWENDIITFKHKSTIKD